MRIAFDAKRLFHNTTGLGNYSRDLVWNLAEFYPDNSYELYSPSFSNLEEAKPFLTAPFQGIAAGSVWKPYWRSFGIVDVLKKNKPFVYHGLSHELPIGLHKTDIKTVVTVHDLIFKKYPKMYSLWDRYAHDYKCKYACKTATQIIAISLQTKKDIMEYYEIEENKISVVTPMCHPRFFEQKTAIEKETIRLRYGLPADFLLYVGSIIERKNLLTVLEALRSLPANLDIPLVVIGGGKNSYRKKCEEFIRENGLEKRIIFPSFVVSDDLPAIYQSAKVFLYPSVYEGFGIPVIEAIFSGVPAIISEHEALREAGGEGAVSIPPFDVEQMGGWIANLLENNNLSTEIVEKGRIYVEKYRPKVVTDRLMEVYRAL